MMTFESLASAKYFIPEQGKYKVQVQLLNSTVGMTIAHGYSLETATILPVTESRTLEFKIDPIKDPSTNGFYRQYIWVFTYMFPLHSSGANFLSFGYKSGENDHDVTKVTVVGTTTAAAGQAVRDVVIPKDNQIIPTGWTSDRISLLGRGYLVAGSKFRTITVDHTAKSLSKIEKGATVVLFDRNNGNIHGVWDGVSYKTPISYAISESDAWELFAIVKGTTDAIWGDKKATFDFSVGDPRKEATVIIEEEEDV